MAAGNLKLSMHHLLKFITIKYFFSTGSNNKCHWPQETTQFSCVQRHFQSMGFVSTQGGINYTCKDAHCYCLFLWLNSVCKDFLSSSLTFHCNYFTSAKQDLKISLQVFLSFHFELHLLWNHWLVDFASNDDWFKWYKTEGPHACTEDHYMMEKAE